MEPEAFDQFCQRKLAQLTQVPDLEWEEEKVWQKIQRHLRGGSFSFRYLSALLILVSILGWFTMSRPDKLLVPDHTRTQPVAKRPTAKPDKTARRDRSKPAVNPVNLPETKAQAVKKTFSRRTTADSTKPLSIVEQLPGKPVVLPKTKQPSITSQKTLPEAMPQQEQAITTQRVTTDTVQENLSGSRKQKEQERYLASGGNGPVTGTREVWHVSRRLSLVHGLQVMQSYTASGAPEMPAELQLDYALQLPLEVRYYLLPKENRFTVFLYGNLLPSLVLSQPVSLVSRHPVGLSLQAGAEARYRLFTTKHGSKAFFSLRLPVYQRSLLSTPASRGHSLWWGGTF
jgi:hypothetical protein